MREGGKYHSFGRYIALIREAASFIFSNGRAIKEKITFLFLFLKKVLTAIMLEGGGVKALMARPLKEKKKFRGFSKGFSRLSMR